MSRFNLKTESTTKSINNEGEESFLLSPEMDFYTKVCTSTLQPKFYTPNSNTQIEELRNLIKNVDPKLVCKLAIYAREKMYLRSIPLVLLVELFKSFEDKNNKYERDGTLLRKTVTRVIQRADEITELLSYYSSANDRKDTKKLGKLPNAMKRGISEAFHKFDEYKLAKYNSGKEIKLRDALFLSHPKAKNTIEQKVFDKLTKNTLDTPVTWETQISLVGQNKYATVEDKKEAFKNTWENLVTSESLGFMSLLRNLRNILESGASKETITKLCSKLSNEEDVLKSKQFPFRFFSAYRELTKAENTLDAFSIKEIKKSLEKAVKISVKNIKGFDENTRVLVACDVSGSMQQAVSEKSTVELYDIGLLMGQLLQSRCNTVVTGFFGERWKVTDFADTNVLANTLNLRNREGEVGYATNGYLVLEWLNNTNTEVDKIMLFTDCELWNSNNDGASLQKEWTKYKIKYPKTKLYLFNLSGYGTSPLNIDQDKNVAMIGGWSEKIFEVLDAVENGQKVIDYIKQVEL